MSETDTEERQFELLLSYLKHSRGFDFSGYKPVSLQRRIQKRMQQAQTDSYVAYIDYLEVHPQEFTQLFNTILINVTSFFRDLPAWEYLQAETLPQINGAKGADEPIRAWCAGVASGEEAYSLAIALCELIGEDAFRARVKIYATDVDDEALAHARAGVYARRQIGGVPETLLEKYFENMGGQYVFRRDLRRSLIFGRHDLLQDPPIPRIDLLICRNTLMYFNSEAQGRILTRFHFALGESGFLFLGRAEMLFTHANLFFAVDLKRRIFAKSPRVGARDRLMVLTGNGNDEAANHLAKHVRFRESAFDAGPVAQIVVDINLTLAMANQRARTLLGLASHDIGRPLSDLHIAYRVDRLRNCVEQTISERREGQLQEVEWRLADGESVYLDILTVPLPHDGSALLGASITLEDVTPQRRLQGEYARASEELETAFEELESTNEELETTNEELQSTVEELETTNEELQSTNEELETMNEEQEATNEELQAMNDEMQRRTGELNGTRLFLESILSSLRSGVVVLNRDLQVQAWNRHAEDQWGLRAGEALGQHFFNLDIGLPLEGLRQGIRACLNEQSDGEHLTVAATNRRGRAISCRVTVSPLHDADHRLRGVIVIMAESDDELLGGQRAGHDAG